MSLASGSIPAGTAPPLAVAMSTLMNGTPAPTNRAWPATGQPRPTLICPASGLAQPQANSPANSAAGSQERDGLEYCVGIMPRGFIESAGAAPAVHQCCRRLSGDS